MPLLDAVTVVSLTVTKWLLLLPNCCHLISTPRSLIKLAYCGQLLHTPYISTAVSSY